MDDVILAMSETSLFEFANYAMVKGRIEELLIENLGVGMSQKNYKMETFINVEVDKNSTCRRKSKKFVSKLRLSTDDGQLT